MCRWGEPCPGHKAPSGCGKWCQLSSVAWVSPGSPTTHPSPEGLPARGSRPPLPWGPLGVCLQLHLPKQSLASCFAVPEPCSWQMPRRLALKPRRVGFLRLPRRSHICIQTGSERLYHQLVNYPEAGEWTQRLSPRPVSLHPACWTCCWPRECVGPQALPRPLHRHLCRTHAPRADHTPVPVVQRRPRASDAAECSKQREGLPHSSGGMGSKLGLLSRGLQVALPTGAREGPPCLHQQLDSQACASVRTRLLLCVCLVSQIISVIYPWPLWILRVHAQSALPLQTPSLTWARYTAPLPHLACLVASSSTPQVARPPGLSKTHVTDAVGCS